MDIIAVVIAVAAAFAVVILLDANHRRTSDLDRSPFGVDLEADRDRIRIEHDLDAAQAHEDQAHQDRARQDRSFPRHSVTGHGSRYAA